MHIHKRNRIFSLLKQNQHFFSAGHSFPYYSGFPSVFQPMKTLEICPVPLLNMSCSFTEMDEIFPII